MNVLEHFKPVPTWTVDELKEFLDRSNPDDYTLLDVRELQDYERKHLPGARPIPLGELEERHGELDPQKPTIVYCHSGPGSRAAAAILSHAGFRQVVGLKGGLRAWNGLAAEGAPASGIASFAAARSPEECIALAWHLESGTRRFYEAMAEKFDPRVAETLFLELTAAESQHQRMLAALYEGLTKKKPDRDFPAGLLAEEPSVATMEGGILLEEALAWSEGKTLGEILELAVGVEANAYDRYLCLRRELKDENARRIFEVLSDEEKRHLKKLIHLRDHFGAAAE